MKAALIIVALQLALAALGGWALMLAVGIVHHEWITACPTIPFAPAIILSALLRAALFSPDRGGE